MTAKNERGSRSRQGWVPNQHGAWAMVVVPYWIGALQGEDYVFLTLLVFAVWFVGYFAFFSASQYFLSKGRRGLKPTLVYTTITALLGLTAAFIRPWLLAWAVPFVPLAALALERTVHHAGRSLVARSATILAAGMMTLVGYACATGVQTISNLFSNGHIDTGVATNENASLTGWPWVFLLSIILTTYFWLSVPYVKSLVRNRGSIPMVAPSIGTHVLASIGVSVAVFHTWLHPINAFIWWIFLAGKSAFAPWYSAHTGKRIRPKVIGYSEVGIFILVIIALLVS